MKGENSTNETIKVEFVTEAKPGTLRSLFLEKLVLKGEKKFGSLAQPLRSPAVRIFA